MELNGHDFIDILKVDIEGNEFDSLSTFIDSFHGEPLPFGQIQLEVHVYQEGSWGNFAKFLKWIMLSLFWEFLDPLSASDLHWKMVGGIGHVGKVAPKKKFV